MMVASRDNIGEGAYQPTPGSPFLGPVVSDQHTLCCTRRQHIGGGEQ